MTATSTATSELPAEIAAAWERALAVWGVHVSLSPPRSFKATHDKTHWPGNEPLAFIDMATRQVVINFELLKKIGAWDSLTGVLAHEIGHHVAFPHTLGLAAELEILQQRLLRGVRQSLTNLFFDLQVNEVVGRELQHQLCAVYRGFTRESDEPVAALFGFYLAIYEALWQRPVGDLLPEDQAEALEEQFGGFRADAWMFVQTFYSLPTSHLQFAYFCSRFARYLADPETNTGEGAPFPMSGDVQAPSAGDFAGALGGSPYVDEAMEEARDRGWFDGVDNGSAAGAGDEDPLSTMNDIANRGGVPGTASGAFVRVVADRIYARLVERYLLDIPATDDPPTPEPSIPTTVVPWEVGDDARAIDWTQSVLRSGHLAGVMPVKRELEPDVPLDQHGGMPSLEIYLDTSGSMPNPVTRTNAMTLAAQVLSASCVRVGGRVRGIIYSAGEPKVSDWMYGEKTAREFFLHYVGGGTDYPVKVLTESVEEWPDAIRVVLSDGDYLWNYKAGEAEVWKKGVEGCRLYIAMLNTTAAAAKRDLAPLLKLEPFRLVIVHSMDSFARAAADLTRALFGER